MAGDSLPSPHNPTTKRAYVCTGVIIKKDGGQALSDACYITVGTGAPTHAPADGSLYFRQDGGTDSTVYQRRGGSWEAIGSDAIADTNAYYTTDTAGGALDALALQLGGDTDATFAFTEGNIVSDDDAVYAAIDSLDQWAGDLEDQFVNATIAVADASGGATAAALTVSLVRAQDNSTDIASARQVLILATDAQYEPVPSVSLVTNVTFATATTGTIAASGPGWALVTTDASGDFACTASNSTDETAYFRVLTPTATDAAAERCVVVHSNSDDATWSA